MSAQAKQTTDRTNTAYYKNVILVNSQLKTNKGTFAGALKLLNVLLDVDSPKHIQDTVKKALKNEVDFKVLSDATRRNKNGSVSPFYILQAIYKLNK